jgi:UDP-glucose:(heptosyl)LPS alpha-1,3-glucosyltransferase
MQIAIIKSNYTPYGGGEKYATRIINAFDKKDIHVDVLTAESGMWEGSHQKSRFITLKQSQYNNLLKLLTFNASVNRHLKNTSYDCIFGMDRTEYQTHMRAGGGCHAAWIQRRCQEHSILRCLSFRINPFHRMMINIERRAFLSQKLKRIFCNSNLVKKDIIHYYPDAKDKITVVHNGVEWHEFSKAFSESETTKGDLLQSLTLYPDRYYFLFVGSGYERKGLRKALAALTLLPTSVELIVVGKDKNENKYKKIASKTGLGQRVHFFGPQKNVTPFFQVSDSFILPTLYDPFSNASLEALAMGLYTVTSNANGCSEVIKDGAGFVIEDNSDIDSIAEAMKTALHKRLSKPEIRESVRHLDFDSQLYKIVDVCLSDIETLE